MFTFGQTRRRAPYNTAHSGAREQTSAAERRWGENPEGLHTRLLKAKRAYNKRRAEELTDALGRSAPSVSSALKFRNWGPQKRSNDRVETFIEVWDCAPAG